MCVWASVGVCVCVYVCAFIIVFVLFCIKTSPELVRIKQQKYAILVTQRDIAFDKIGKLV